MIAVYMKKIKVLVMGNLCADIILGQDFIDRHKSVVFTFNGKEPTLQVCALTPIFLVTVN